MLYTDYCKLLACDLSSLIQVMVQFDLLTTGKDGYLNMGMRTEDRTEPSVKILEEVLTSQGLHRNLVHHKTYQS